MLRPCEFTINIYTKELNTIYSSILILSIEVLYSHGVFVHPKTMKFVLDKISESLFTLNHAYNLFISVDTFVHISNKSLPSTTKNWCHQRTVWTLSVTKHCISH